jgi:hypothetical protein
MLDKLSQINQTLTNTFGTGSTSGSTSGSSTTNSVQGAQ